ncbi:3'-5' exoribonuclease [compost metagenome]
MIFSKQKTPGRTKIFFDEEFTGLHKNTSIISIGLVSETGSTFYAEFTDYNKSQVDSWIDKNVIANLAKTQDKIANLADVTVIGDRRTVTQALDKWLRSFRPSTNGIEMWSDCLSYDWVLFNDLFGGAMEKPDYIYYIPFDICTLMYIKGVDPDINREDFSGTLSGNKHNALHDAKVIKKCYDKLIHM